MLEDKLLHTLLPVEARSCILGGVKITPDSLSDELDP